MIQIDLDNNVVKAEEKILETLKMPQKEFRNLKEKLMRATACIKQRPHQDIESVDLAFQNIFMDPEDDEV